ncbi:MAG: hypothetical protein MZW92_68490 [Comamonadaceae bacterium]|nr:hypothetical protein [Comamonadaceae bacterium]
MLVPDASKPPAPRAEVEAELVWESDGRPVLAGDAPARRPQPRRRGVPPRSDLDPDARETATSRFVSDDVHYAWPFLRLDPAWNGEHGGRITSDSGATGQEATNMKPALWIDYSNTRRRRRPRAWPSFNAPTAASTAG